MLKGYTWFGTLELFLMVLKGPYGLPEIELR